MSNTNLFNFSKILASNSAFLSSLNTLLSFGHYLTTVSSHITQLILTGTACPGIPSAERVTNAAQKGICLFSWDIL